MKLMSRAELESLGITDAQLVAEAKRLFGMSPNILDDDDDDDMQRARRYAFDLVTARWMTGTTHVVGSTPAGPNARDFPETHFGLAVEAAERAAARVLDEPDLARFRAIGAELLRGLRGGVSRSRFAELRAEAHRMLDSREEGAVRGALAMFSTLARALGYRDEVRAPRRKARRR